MLSLAASTVRLALALPLELVRTSVSKSEMPFANVTHTDAQASTMTHAAFVLRMISLAFKPVISTVVSYDTACILPHVPGFTLGYRF